MSRIKAFGLCLLLAASTAVAQIPSSTARNSVTNRDEGIAGSLSLGSAVTSTGAQTAIRPRYPMTAFAIGSTSSGSGSATVVIEISNDRTNYITACTITLTLSTTVSADGCGIAIPWVWVRMNVTAISGTGASVSGWAAAQ